MTNIICLWLNGVNILNPFPVIAIPILKSSSIWDPSSYSSTNLSFFEFFLNFFSPYTLNNSFMMLVASPYRLTIVIICTIEFKIKSDLERSQYKNFAISESLGSFHINVIVFIWVYHLLLFIRKLMVFLWFLVNLILLKWRLSEMINNMGNIEFSETLIPSLILVNHD